MTGQVESQELVNRAFLLALGEVLESPLLLPPPLHPALLTLGVGVGAQMK